MYLAKLRRGRTERKYQSQIKSRKSSKYLNVIPPPVHHENDPIIGDVKKRIIFKPENKKYTQECSKENRLKKEFQEEDFEKKEEDWELKKTSVKKVIARIYNEKEQGPIRFEDQNENISKRKLEKVRRMQEVQRERILGGEVVKLTNDSTILEERRSPRNQIYDKYEKNLHREEYIKTERPIPIQYSNKKFREDTGKKLIPLIEYKSAYSKKVENVQTEKTPKLEENSLKKSEVSGSEFTSPESNTFRIKPIRASSGSGENIYVSPEKISKGQVGSFDSSSSSHDVYHGLRDNSLLMEEIRKAQESNLGHVSLNCRDR